MSKIATVKYGGEEHVAVFHDGRWLNATRAAAHFGAEEAATSVLALLRAGMLDAAFCARTAEAAEAHPDCVLEEPVEFALPIRPGKIVAIGRNYRGHVAEFDNQIPSELIFFAKSVTACIPNGAPIVLKDWHGRVDHEGELAFIIGKRATEVPAAAAREYVAGYTIINDVTARTIHKADAAVGNPWYRAKNMDTFCPLGPVIVLPEALGWPVAADIEVRVNGEVRQKANTSDFIFSIEEMIAGVSKHMTLEVGDIISTGTPEGVSPLSGGDIVEVTIPEIGTLRNPVVAR